MSKDDLFENRPVRVALPNKIKGYLVRAQIEEALGEIPETTIEFVTSDLDLDLQKVVGARMGLDSITPFLRIIKLEC